MPEELQISTGRGWTTYNFPACSFGMELVRLFQAACSKDYAFLEVRDFADLSTSTFDGILEWDSFTEHCATWCGTRLRTTLAGRGPSF